MNNALQGPRWIPAILLTVIAWSMAAEVAGSSAVEARGKVSPAPQFQAAMAYDAARKTVILFSNDDRGQTWAWDGRRWTRRHPEHSPSPRTGAQMAYNAARQRTVLFGGSLLHRGRSGAWLLGDTWTWDGTDWQRQSSTSAPSPRFGTVMTYDPERRVVVLFGGYGRPNEFFYDTWTWDGSAWKQLSATTPPRFFGNADAMAYDRPGHRAMFFAFPGGLPSEQAMWFFDGSVWTRQAVPPGKLPLDGEGMVYDEALGRIVEFGGEDAGVSPSGRSVRSDMWVWDGRSWSPLRASRTPPPRLSMSMVYDSHRRQLVVFGGLDGADRPLGDTWTWDGSTWTSH